MTSICGIPRLAGAIPSSLNKPNCLLSFDIGRSPCNTLMSTAGWLSAAVENTCDLDVGIVVFRSISVVITPPIVSIPNDNGVTSNRSTSETSPEMTPAWIAAPIATTSSGLTDLFGSLPNSCLTASTTAGIRVDPPTKITWLMSFFVSFESRKAFLTGINVRSTNFFVISSNLARERVVSK